MVAKKSETAPAGQPGQATAPAGQARGQAITKHEAVRRALATIGQAARPLDIQRFVQEQFGLDMTTDHISVAKGKIRHERLKAQTPGKAQPTTRKAQGKTETAAKAQPPAKKSPAKKQTPAKAQGQTAKGGSRAGTLSVQDVAAVKELVRRVGGDELRTLIDLLAR